MKIRMLGISTLSVAMLAAIGMSSAFAMDNGMSHSDMMKAMDTNGDGMVSADEHAAWAKAQFDKMDTNHDGMMSKTEMDAGMQNHRMKHKMKSDSMKSDSMKSDSMKSDSMKSDSMKKDDSTMKDDNMKSGGSA